MLGLPDQTRAVLFDLDGVLTDTASVHKKAWKAMFDDFLRRRADRSGEDFVGFDVDADYLDYVDGKRREDGVRSFLASRDIRLPEGDPGDGPDTETVYGLGNRKNEAFVQTLHRDGVKVFDGSRRYLQATHDAGLGVAVVSSSANTKEVLELTGLDKFVQHRVDGVVMRDENIAGKPAPDSFLRAAEMLRVSPQRSVVVEDAISGVAAGVKGGFGLVVGVDRTNNALELLNQGAHLVVTDLADLLTTAVETPLKPAA